MKIDLAVSLVGVNIAFENDQISFRNPSVRYVLRLDMSASRTGAIVKVDQNIKGAIINSGDLASDGNGLALQVGVFLFTHDLDLAQAMRNVFPYLIERDQNRMPSLVILLLEIETPSLDPIPLA